MNHEKKESQREEEKSGKKKKSKTCRVGLNLVIVRVIPADPLGVESGEAP